MFLIKIHSKNEVFNDQNQNKEYHKFYFSTVQENLVKFFLDAKLFDLFCLILRFFILRLICLII